MMVRGGYRAPSSLTSPSCGERNLRPLQNAFRLGQNTLKIPIYVSIEIGNIARFDGYYGRAQEWL